MTIKTLALFTCLFFSCVLHAQETKFDETGKLTTLKVKRGESDMNRLADFKTNLLKKEDADIKKESSDILLKKVEETIELLENSTSNSFYHLLWGNTASDSLYLAQLKELLTDSIPARPLHALAAIFKQCYGSNLSGNAPNIFSTKFDPAKPYSISLLKKDAFNQFIIDYYNKSLPKLKQANIDLSSSTIEYKVKWLQQCMVQIQEQLSTYYQARNLSATQYQQFRNLHEVIQEAASPFTSIKKMLQQDWFKLWFWFRGGEIRLNPLDFTTEDFLKANPGFDTIRSAKFNEYIDSIINRQLRYDSTGRIEEFKAKLALQETGKQVFSFKQRNDSLVKINAGQRKALLTTSQVLNKVEIPEKGVFYNFSAVADVKVNHDLEGLEQNLRTNEYKVIALHNITVGSKAGLLESDKPITDRSAFQEGFDTVVSQMGAIARLVAQLTPYGSFFNLLSPATKPNPTIIINKSSFPDSTIGFEKNKRTIRTLDLGNNSIDFIVEEDGRENIKHYLQQVLTDEDLFDQELFLTYFQSLADPSLNQLVSKERGMPALINTYKIAIEEYLKQLQIRQVQLVQCIQQDSLLIAGFIDIYTKSTLPMMEPLKAEKPGAPLYSTKILTTETSKDAIEKSVAVYTLNKDTTIVGKFSYKVGKHHRFSLGAGIGYTLTNYNQSVATESNGQILITNNVRLYRFIAGLHVYLGKNGLFMQDNRFLGRFCERISAFAGVGIPDPLANVYLGFGYDLWPGLKLNGGFHFVKDNRYLIQNNQIVEETLRYKVGGPYLGLTLDPTSLINLLNVFKN